MVTLQLTVAQVQPMMAGSVVQEVVQLLNDGPVCPDSAVAIQRYLEEQYPNMSQGS